MGVRKIQRIKGVIPLSDPIIVALIGLAGSAIGSLIGVLASSKLTQYRIEQLEKKVDSQNRFTALVPIIEEIWLSEVVGK